MAPAIGWLPSRFVTRPDSEAGVGGGFALRVPAVAPAAEPADAAGASSGDDEWLHPSFQIAIAAATTTTPAITVRRTATS
jgi:hypothetical protein